MGISKIKALISSADMGFVYPLAFSVTDRDLFLFALGRPLTRHRTQFEKCWYIAGLQTRSINKIFNNNKYFQLYGP